MTYGYSALEVEKSAIISVQFAAAGMICMFLNFSFTYLKSLGLSTIEKLKSPILYFEAYIYCSLKELHYFTTSDAL